MELMGGILLVGLLFGGRSCKCYSCIKARREEDKEWAKWYKKKVGSSVSLSPSASLSPSSSVSPSA